MCAYCPYYFIGVEDRKMDDFSYIMKSGIQTDLP